MAWAVSSATFVGTIMVVVALIYAYGAEDVGVAERLSRLRDTPAPEQQQRFAERQIQRARQALASLGSLVPGVASRQTSRSQLIMIRAGYRSADARTVIRGAKLILPILLLAVALLTGAYRYSPVYVLLGAAGAGALLPEIWLQWRVRIRQRRLRMALPDGLDLLAICVEVGLGIDQALLRVAQELHVVHRELSEELQIVNLEMRVGKTRIEALRELARRTGIEDIRTLVAMLVQTERFGTSIDQSLRVHSEELRTKRRQRAEERSAKTSVKMVGPLVFFIFPALMVVVLGPAIITLVRHLVPSLK